MLGQIMSTVIQAYRSPRKMPRSSIPNGVMAPKGGMNLKQTIKATAMALLMKYFVFVADDFSMPLLSLDFPLKPM